MKYLNIIFIFTLTYNLHAIEIEKILEKRTVKQRLAKEFSNLDVNFKIDIFNNDLTDGVNLASNYKYEVEPSYQENYYTRADIWNLNFEIDAATVIQDHLDLPFGFKVRRNGNFTFIRQFPHKSSALKANAYYPNKLPITAEKALKLNSSDFVAIPATLNLAFTKGSSITGASNVTPINANVGAFFVVSGEFTIQVYKLDEKHVRLKLISNRSLSSGISGEAKTDIQLLGFKVFSNGQSDVSGQNNGIGARADKQLQNQSVRFIDRIIDRELLSFGINYTPGASYIADYVFDLTDEKAKEAYNQIMSTCYKLKGVVVLDHFLNAKDLTNNFYTTTSIADNLAAEDHKLPIENRRVIRIFKGFNNYESFNRGIKIGAFLASFQYNSNFVENKLTVIDKNDHSLEFFYPTITKYHETKIGRSIFEIKDQDNKIFFGLIPKQNSENVDYRSPDIGLTYERKDKYFRKSEFKSISKYMKDQIPEQIINKIEFDKWNFDQNKSDARLYFQVVLKAQGFNSLKKYSKDEIYAALFEFLKKKKMLHIAIKPTDDFTTPTYSDRVEDDFNANNYDPNRNVFPKVYESEQIKLISTLLYHALNDDQVSEKKLAEIVKLNEIPLFLDVGLGFLVSLLPPDKIDQFVYVKIEMNANDTDAINKEFGKLNYSSLYKEINIIQSRLNNRSFDLRMTKDDLELEEKENQILNIEQ